ncbi:caspase activity and apoptosis inhibitor 1 [Cyanistes caeruleus]|uniref:caspase activity and apoptosis inhibitor 1 n=1 Tax=Cyanistes caeruleus TaxID=156563 RepID=UPI000CDBA36C|nr:caspase activity and apoptosis inhibitor 1 [Cyanistes caeruleus]
MAKTVPPPDKTIRHMGKTQLVEHEDNRYVFTFRKTLKTITEKQISRQDNSVDSTSSLREDSKLEGQESKQGKGEDSDVLSINADAYDSDIEGPCNEEDGPDVQESTVRSGAGQIDDLQKDIEKSVNEILGLAESSPKEPKAATSAVPPSEDVQPSAQQLELLELEMRARAIKALMKAGDVKKHP